MSKEFHNSWIGVDLDNTLAYHDHYRGDDHIGVPIRPMVEKVKKWLEEGYEVRIFTARSPHPAIRAWSKEHLGKVLPITNKKDKYMIAFFDDRAVGVRRNEGKLFSEENEAQAFRKHF